MLISFFSSFRALQFPPEGWLRMGLNNGSITWLTIRPSGRVALRTMGDAGFMPPDKLTRTWWANTPQVSGTPMPSQLVAGSKLSFLLKCLENYCWCCYFVIELPSCNERLCGCDYFRAIERQQKWLTAAQQLLLNVTEDFYTSDWFLNQKSCICIAVVNADHALSFTCHYSLLKWG